MKVLNLSPNVQIKADNLAKQFGITIEAAEEILGDPELIKKVVQTMSVAMAQAAAQEYQNAVMLSKAVIVASA
jgi:hypothetical protein